MAEREGFHVISSGSYSDYRVMCVVPAGEEAAEALAARVRASDTWHSDARVEWLPVAFPDDELHEVLTMSQNIWDDGRNEPGPHINVRQEWPFDGLYGHTRPVQWRWVRARTHKGEGGRLEVHGTDHERVRRVFSDKRAEIIATPSLAKRKEATG